jgi:hypothetical protein
VLHRSTEQSIVRETPQKLGVVVVEREHPAELLGDGS